MTTTKEPGKKLMSQIAAANNLEKFELLKRKVLESLKEDQEKASVSESDLLGYLFNSFLGLDCDVVHSGGDESVDKVLEEIIIHFADPKNLDGFSKEVRPYVLRTLSELLKFFHKLNPYADLLFSYTSLYGLNNWVSLPQETKNGYETWYE